MDKRRFLYGLWVGSVFVLSLFITGVIQTEAQTAPAKVFSWKLESAYPPPEKIMDHWGAYGMAAEVARRVKERTKGGLEIKVFPPMLCLKPLSLLMP